MIQIQYLRIYLLIAENLHVSPDSLLDDVIKVHLAPSSLIWSPNAGADSQGFSIIIILGGVNSDAASSEKGTFVGFSILSEKKSKTKMQACFLLAS